MYVSTLPTRSTLLYSAPAVRYVTLLGVGVTRVRDGGPQGRRRSVECRETLRAADFFFSSSYAVCCRRESIGRSAWPGAVVGSIRHASEFRLPTAPRNRKGRDGWMMKQERTRFEVAVATLGYM